jgi:O-antigen/teichoic acid export membrane protein
MDKAMNMGKSSATGSFQLLIGVAASTIIMALGTIILTRLLGTDNYGLYAAAVIPSSMIAFFRDWGVNSAMIKEIASLRTRDKPAEMHDVIFSGVIFEIASGAVLTVVSFGSAELLATLLQRPSITPLIALMSFSIFAGALLSAANAVFVGYEKMNYNSAIQILQAIIKTAAGPLLVLLGYSVFGAVIASVVSVLVAALAAIVIVYVAMFRRLRVVKTGKCEIRKTLSPMLRYGLPLTVANTVVGVVPLMFAFIMAAYVTDNSVFGNYYAALNFVVLLSFISIPISTVLFPAFAKLNPKEEPDLTKTVFASSVKYTSVLLVPATLLVIVLAGPIVYTLFGNAYALAPLFLALYSIINLYTLIGNISVGTFLTGLGEARQLMNQSLLSLVFTLPLAFTLVPIFAGISPTMGIVGGIIGVILSSLPGNLWGILWVWKRYGVKPSYSNSLRILLASAIAALVTYGFLSVFNVFAFVNLVAGFVVFVAVYLDAAPIVGAVNKVDLDNLRSMFSGLGIVSKIVGLLLLIMETSLKLRHNNSSSGTSDADGAANAKTL